MLELGSKDSAAPADDLIIEGSDAGFMTDVIEASKTVPVIVDFWATWCGPCRTLGPAIEAAVTAAKGAVKLVKIDVDQNQVYAGQLRVQSIPTVYAFWQGQPVDGFQGALPASQVNEFVTKIAAMGNGGAADAGLDEALDAAEAMLEEGAAADAAETFAAILQEEPENARAYAGMIRAYLEMEEVDQAEAVLNGAPVAISTSAPIEAARAQIALARQAAKAGPVAELRQKVEDDPDNHQARYDLATALYASGKTEEAVHQLLDLFRRDREWNGGAAKEQVLQIFGALKPNDPIVIAGRRKLSSMIFA
ncbi:MAG: tetratricopeptide repeat protein [Limimaricola sp.]|uniref:thioredoxin family protein n=1 Tax=Limimaricola sp. TaxID=2211665 RepID=UPI001DA85128|nr:co-chaperone YbbN [Limimaricola sp.]MBI1416998.1 tetratricopeptide repeat protein [Limimaricola sp.]